jgi:hypothetical protein
MPTIRSERWAGGRVYLGDGLVQFDEEGVAVGVVERAGRALDPPAPVGPSQVESALQSDSYVVEGVAEAAAAEEAAAVATPEVPAPEPEVAAAPEAAAPDRPDLATMDRAAKYHYAKDVLGLDVDWLHTKTAELERLIREAWAEADGQ